MGKLIPYLFVFAGIVIGLLAVPFVVDTLSLRNDVGEFHEVEARVLSHGEKSHGKGPKTQQVKFEFVTTAGVEIRGDNRFTSLSDDAESIDRLVRRENGRDVVTVYYDPDQPKRHVIRRDIDIWRPVGILVFVFIAVFGGGHAVMIDSRRRKLQARADADRAAKEAARRAAKERASEDGEA